MKTILVDAVNTFVVDGKVDEEMHELLEKYPGRKIVLTNADDAEKVEYGLSDLPYSVFTLKHKPNKTDPSYFEQMLDLFALSPADVVYFEHNPDAVESARSVGIASHHFDHEERDLNALKEFLDENAV